MADDHPRITTREVCALARYGRATLFRRIDAGQMPHAIDRGGDGFLFDRKAVLVALGLADDALKAPEKSWHITPEEGLRLFGKGVRHRRLAGEPGGPGCDRHAMDRGFCPPTPKR